MNVSAIEPLDPSAWVDSLARMRTQIASHSDGECSSFLRKTFHLLVLSPAPLRPIFFPQLPEETFEHVLEEAQDIAALSLLKTDMSFHVASANDADAYVVKLRLPASQETIEIVNSSLARGIVLAISEAAIRLFEEPRTQRT